MMEKFDHTKLIAGKYRLVKKLGSGAFGSVYLAEQEAYGLSFRNVAIKFFNIEIKDRSMARNVFNDAIILTDLIEDGHDIDVMSKFVLIYDVGSIELIEEGKGIFEKGYITMEKMDTDLRKIVGEPGASNFRKCTVTEILTYMTPVIDALAFMHSRNRPIIHRDLKPENILLREGEKEGVKKIQIKIADFGLAVQMFNLLELPDSGGTIPYQDLESFTKRNASTESDVYAVGVIFYELLTGRYPFKIDTLNISSQDPLSQKILADRLGLAMSKPPRPTSEYNYELKNYPWLEELILKCLKPNRVNRIKNAIVLKDCLKKRDVISSEKTVQEKYKEYHTSGKDNFARGKQYWAAAKNDFNAAIKLLPRHCDAIVDLAQLLIEETKFDDAELLLRERIEHNRDCEHVYQKLAYLYGKKNIDAMREYYTQKTEKCSCAYTIYK